jgi:hypothetical protein
MMRLPEGPGSRVLLVVRQSDVLERHYKKLPDDVTKNIGVSGWALVSACPETPISKVPHCED